MVGFEKELRSRAAGIGDSIAVRGPADHGAASDLDLMLLLDESERRLDDAEPQAHPRAQLDAAELADEVERLERELDDEVQRQAGLLQCRRRRRMRQNRWDVGFAGQHVESPLTG